MNVVFQNRDFSEMPKRGNAWAVARMSWQALGGPDKAGLTGPADVDKWEALKLLRCPVFIFADDGSLAWWGFVNRVTVPHGNLRIGLSLEKMANKVAVHYANLPDGNTTPNSAPITTWATDIVSQAEYGIKELIYQLSQGNESQANTRRDTLFARSRYPVSSVELSGGNETISIECLGWWHSLEWRYYSDSGTGSVETTTQIKSVATACGQFLRGSVISNASGVSSNQNRDGRESALDIVRDLLLCGASDGQRLLAKISSDRTMFVQKPSSDQYFIRQDGRVETYLGILAPGWKDISGSWLSVKDAPPVLGGYASIQPFLVESMEYSPATDRVVYRPAGEVDQFVMLGDE